MEIFQPTNDDYDQSGRKSREDQKDQNHQKEIKQLGQIRFWRERLKFNTSLKYLFFFLYGIHLIDLFITNEFSLNPTFYFLDIIIIITIIFALHIVKKIKYYFQDIINTNSSIFKSEESFRNYHKFLIRRYKTKKEQYIPIIFYFIWFSISFSNNFITIITGTYELGIPSLSLLMRILKIGSWILWYYLALNWMLIVGSAFIIFITTFMCINKLGSEEFPLRVTYEDLKIGAFEKIGKFIISLSIPAILLGTFFSIVGLGYIFLMKNYLYGYLMLSASLIITILFAGLLYKNTIHIHEAIVSFKEKLKQNLIDQIQELTWKQKDASDLSEKHMMYHTIYNIHDYYEKVDDINDWPFNPTSLRKLTITFSSSVLPFLLSFIGIA
jgi:hypothetical protein